MRHCVPAMLLLATGSAFGQSLTEIGVGNPFAMSDDAATILAADSGGQLVLWNGGVSTPIGSYSNGGGVPDIDDAGIAAAATRDNAGLAEAAHWDGAAWMFVGGLGSSSGSSKSSSYGISGDGGTVVGLGWVTPGSAHAFRWTSAGGIVDLGSSGNSSRANGANHDASVIVGWDEHPTGGFRRAARWVNGVLTVDTPDDPAEYYNVSASGSAAVGTHSGAAMIWDDVNGIQTFGPLPGTTVFGSAIALDVTDDGGMMVGVNLFDFGPFAAQDPILWSPSTGFVNLTAYLPTIGITIPAGLDLRSAVAISGDGRFILCLGRYSLADARVILIDLTGEGCYADCEEDGDLDVFDFLCFQGEYASQSAYADCEEDGDWDVFDFLCFQGLYASGCD